MDVIDGNVWYQLTETRVDFNSSLQQAGNGVVMAAAGPKTLEFWQLFPIGSGLYQIRNRNTGVNKQLATCYNAQEQDPSNTQPCLEPSSGDQSQLWNITQWGDGTFKFVNVGNGSNYNMDCHPGNPMFMASEIAAVPRQPAQHWEFSSLSQINDGAYSTTITNLPTSTSSTTPASAAASTTSSAGKVASAGITSQASPESTPTDIAASSNGSSVQKKGSISTAAAVGTGVAVGLTFCLLVAALLFFCQRRKRNSNIRRVPMHELGGEGPGINDKKQSIMAHEMAVPPSELPTQNFQLYELDRGTSQRSHKSRFTESYT